MSEETINVNAEIMEKVNNLKKIKFFDKVKTKVQKHWKKVAICTAIGVSGYALGHYVTNKDLIKDGENFYNSIDDNDKKNLDEMIENYENKLETKDE